MDVFPAPRKPVKTVIGMVEGVSGMSSSATRHNPGFACGVRQVIRVSAMMPLPGSVTNSKLEHLQ